MDRLTYAFLIANEIHHGQIRKYTNLPYIVHPIRVSLAVASYPGTKTEWIAAGLLHDVREDAVFHDESDKEKLDERIKSCCGDEIFKLVEELTNPSKGLKLPRAERKRIDREHLQKVSQPAKIIKVLDRIDNLRDIKDAPGDFKKLYAEESKLLFEVINIGLEKCLTWQIDDAIKNIIS